MKQEIVVLTHNPKGKWGDVRLEIDKNKIYKGWGKSVKSLSNGQLVLIYISKTVFQIQYLMKVVNTTESTVDLILLYKFNNKITKKLSYQNLVLHGLKPSTVNYILNNNHPLFQYVTSNINKYLISEGYTITSKSSYKKEELMSLNQILYGPPGTGKTYNTINRALEIIDGQVSDNRSEVKARFEELSKAGQIEFVTFHQSFGYEEFVEGIKANTVDGNISYDVESGVFKRLSEKAQKGNRHQEKKYRLNAKSLNIQAELVEDNKDTYRVLSGSKIRKGEAPSFQNYNYSALKKMVLEKAKYSEESEFYILEEDYVFQSLSAASSVILGRQSNGYNDWKEVLEINSESKNNKKYILIIDEINRGNISKIFGELITLIEPSKRIGAEEEIRLRLPYSNDEFGVPSNLYIIGTMNTADRSIALMDTALRRRFEFVEMMPNADILDFEVVSINLKALLNKINARVEYLYDRDHTIGHAYFMELNAESRLDELNAVMRNRIIPLLQEYFYDDWEKIKLVLNDGFIERIPLKAEKIFENIDDEYIEEDKFLYSIKEDFEQESYLRLCQNS